MDIGVRHLGSDLDSGPNCEAPAEFLDLLSLSLFICKVEIIVLTLQGFCKGEIR